MLHQLMNENSAKTPQTAGSCPNCHTRDPRPTGNNFFYGVISFISNVKIVYMSDSISFSLWESSTLGHVSYRSGRVLTATQQNQEFGEPLCASERTLSFVVS